MVQGRQFANNTSSASATATYERHDSARLGMRLQTKCHMDSKRQTKSTPTIASSGVWGRFQNADDFRRMHNF